MSASPPRAAEGWRLASRIIALMMSIATAGLLVKVADLSAGLSPFLVIMLVWCLSPYALLALALRRPWMSTEAVLVAFATTIAASGFALYIYTVAFFVKPDAQGGLVFLFIPLWQWMGALVGLGVAWLVERRMAVPRATGQ
jgi:hypothetical protein